MYTLNSRYTKSYNPLTGEIVVQSHELKESANRPFIPMLKQNIETGETMIDTRQKVYWKK